MNETIPCETCGQPTPHTGTRRCNNCWEVGRRKAADAYNKAATRYFGKYACLNRI